jgi:hypothetical protein
MIPNYLVGELLKANSQTRQWLVTSSGLGDNGELCCRAVGVARSYLEA